MGHVLAATRFVCVVGVLCLCAGHASAVTIWTEGAENGLGEVVDGTHASYPLIQSEVVGAGAFAFHLAHPTTQDQFFAIDESLTIPAVAQQQTKLFFLSRLRNSTPTQIARVQLSTNNGGSWSNIFGQAGVDTTVGLGGEGAFALKEVDLSPYANQAVRLRFYYDYTGGSRFSGTSSVDGWFVDDIQIGSQYAKIPWSIGDPSPHAQQYLEYINRARADAIVEAERLATEIDADILNAYDFFNIETDDIVDQFHWYVNDGHIARHAQPLSFQAQLLEAAELHTQDLFQNQFQGHNSSDNPPSPFQPGYTPGQRVAALGYQPSSLGENVFSHSESVRFGHAGFDVDWGNNVNTGSPAYNPAFAGQDMQNPAVHRLSIHNGDFKEVGIGVINGPNGNYGPQYVTQDFGTSGNIRYVTGVVYDDVNGNNFYDIGEGKPGVRIDVDGAAGSDTPYYAISSGSGGYSVPVPTDGTYTVYFTGGGFAPFTTAANVAGGLNVKVDYQVTALAPLAGDFNGDNVVDAADYTVWRNNFGDSTEANILFRGDGIPGIGNGDYIVWRRQYGKSSPTGGGQLAAALAKIPEPPTLLLISLSAVLLLGRHTGIRGPKVATPAPTTR